MNEKKLTENQMKLFHQHLIWEEKSKATVEKYLRDVRAFFSYVQERCVTKEIVIEYKKHLQEENYAMLVIC